LPGLVASAVLSALLWPMAAESADAPPACQLVRFASLDMDTLSHGEVAIPATINGHAARLEVDTGGRTSSVSDDFADELGLTRKRDFGGMYLNNVPVIESVEVSSFTLGSLAKNGNVRFSVLPESIGRPDLSGMLGPDVLVNYDVEFDFAAGKFDVFSPDHCPGKVVYWTHDAYAAIPMTDSRFLHILVSASLDGQRVAVAVDTGAPRSFMSLDRAIDLFGWNSDNPPVKQMPSQKINGGAATPIALHAFNMLTFDGVNVVNPDIVLIPKKNFGNQPRHEGELILGMSVLRQLHLYVAYKEQMLYLTAAEAH
jgi:predicted aspartyl protease